MKLYFVTRFHFFNLLLKFQYIKLYLTCSPPYLSAININHNLESLGDGGDLLVLINLSPRSGDHSLQLSFVCQGCLHHFLLQDGGPDLLNWPHISHLGSLPLVGDPPGES